MKRLFAALLFTVGLLLLGTPIAERLAGQGQFAGGSGATNGTFTGNQLLIGTSGQTGAASSITLYGGTSPTAGSSILGGDNALAFPSYLYFDPTVSGNVCVNLAATSGACTTNKIITQKAGADTTGLTANVTSTTLYAVPATGAGVYWVSGYTVVTSVGTTSTLPVVAVGWTDANSSGTPSVTGQTTSATFPGCVPTQTTNTTATACDFGPVSVNAKASTNITYSTTGYASTGTAMQYALHIKILGPF